VVGSPDALGQLTLGFAGRAGGDQRISDQRVDPIVQCQIAVAVQRSEGDIAGVGLSALEGPGDRGIDRSKLELVGQLGQHCCEPLAHHFCIPRSAQLPVSCQSKRGGTRRHPVGQQPAQLRGEPGTLGADL
jgi:hypothetical protein